MGRLAALDPPRWPADVAVEGAVGGPLTVRITDLRSGVSGSASSEEVLEEATGTGLGEVAVRKAVGTLGNTRWSLGGLDVGSLDPGAWAPMGRVKDARRRAVEDLERRVAESEGGPGGHAVASDESSDLHETEEEEEEEEPVVDELLGDIADGGRVRPPDASGEGPRVSVLCRTYDQVDAICRMMEEDISRHDDDEWSSSRACRRVDELIVDFLEVDSLERAVERIRGSGTGAGVVLASPRVIKPGEEGIWKTLLRLRPDGLLVRSTGLLHRLTRLGGTGASVDLPAGGDGRGSVTVAIPELVGDFSLNAANALTAHEYLASGLSRITASYDLSASAITELATHLGGGRGTPGSSRTSLASRLEVVVHCHMPIFHTEHCVFARFLSGGDSYQDCGHVCTRETVHLRDQEGRDNLVLADMGCRNTVFQAESQSGVYSMDEWADAGVGSFRIELVDERGDDAVGVVSSYLAFLAGERQASDVWRALDAVPDSNGRAGGVGVGSLRNASERRSGSLSSISYLLWAHNLSDGLQLVTIMRELCDTTYLNRRGQGNSWPMKMQVQSRGRARGWLSPLLPVRTCEALITSSPLHEGEPCASRSRPCTIHRSHEEEWQSYWHTINGVWDNNRTENPSMLQWSPPCRFFPSHDKGVLHRDLQHVITDREMLLVHGDVWS
ncbi:hypothetical protein THAOC_36161 [Thalassiosira oceanica]|uniref:Peptidase U32 collagenase domain-containing protein n=1 Tax=Thalassiosira oceanica TaxID=159749 RepID=K0QZV6_THAOC|nr:hypothetical protein THAOC_36161 [Thalassiosira oceanica]|eukprot:EJK45233.1 hypothetical protein THAOC_36161 [Thalassiosira oceanica]